MQFPDDLVPLAEAALIAERSERTVRRWCDVGKLTRHEGHAPSGGGLPSVLVSRSELLTVLAVSGQQPRSARLDTEDGHLAILPDSGHPAHPAPVQPAAPGAPGTPLLSASDLEVVRLRGELEVARLGIRIATAEARLAAQAELVGRLEAEARRREEEIAQLRQERDAVRLDGKDWKDRATAAEAELRALRAERGLSWWQRLLSGPALPAHEPT